MGLGLGSGSPGETTTRAAPRASNPNPDPDPDPNPNPNPTPTLTLTLTLTLTRRRHTPRHERARAQGRAQDRRVRLVLHCTAHLRRVSAPVRVYYPLASGAAPLRDDCHASAALLPRAPTGRRQTGRCCRGAARADCKTTTVRGGAPQVPMLEYTMSLAVRNGREEEHSAVR